MPEDSKKTENPFLNSTRSVVVPIEPRQERWHWEILESVGKKIGDEDWYKDLFGGKSKEELTRQKISPDLVSHLIKNLANGRYIGPLETQPINWSETKIYRDFVQNFFDGMRDVSGRPTLDGVIFSQKTVRKNKQSFVEFVISSPAEYDHRYLIHHGGTTKLNDDSLAGGFGEGVKIASFLLIKNRVVEEVELGSDHWRAQYYFDQLPDEDYPEKVDGLHLKAGFVRTGTKGNFLRFMVSEEKATEVNNILAEMKNFFWHSDHPDFKNPTYTNEFGGFTILSRGMKGNLYVAGQRYEYGQTEAWSNQVAGVHIWTFKKVMERTRDRNYAPGYEVTDKIIAPLVNSMKKEDLLKTFSYGEDYWLVPSNGSSTQADSIIDRVVERLGEELPDDEKKALLKSLPVDIFADSGEKEYGKQLEEIGFRRCRPSFKKLGVPTAKEKILSLIDTAQDPNLESWENERLAILKKATQVFVESAKTSIVNRYLKFLKSPGDRREGGYADWGRLSADFVISKLTNGEIPTLTVTQTDALSLRGGRGRIEVHGFTRIFPEKIFLQRKLLGEDFLGALFTWTHEFAHNISGEDDFTARFTDAERYLHELLLINSFSSPKLKDLQKEWDVIVPGVR